MAVARLHRSTASAPPRRPPRSVCSSATPDGFVARPGYDVSRRYPSRTTLTYDEDSSDTIHCHHSVALDKEHPLKTAELDLERLLSRFLLERPAHEVCVDRFAGGVRIVPLLKEPFVNIP